MWKTESGAWKKTRAGVTATVRAVGGLRYEWEVIAPDGSRVRGRRGSQRAAKAAATKWLNWIAQEARLYELVGKMKFARPTRTAWVPFPGGYACESWSVVNEGGRWRLALPNGLRYDVGAKGSHVAKERASFWIERLSE